LPDNPYVAIVTRNVFGLSPPTLETATVTNPTPKITPNGIMSISGRLQVLFKVATTAKPGQPAKDESYNLSEGQRQDDIEVTHIDEKAGLVTFNNHGTVQEIPLANTPATSTAAASAAPGFPMSAVSAGGIPGGNPGGNNNAATFGSRFGRGAPGARNRGGTGGDNSGGGAANFPSMGTSPSGSGAASFSPVGTTPASAANFGQSPRLSQLTPDERMVLIAAQKAKLQSEGNPAHTLFPPTPYDAEAGVAPPPAPGSPSQ
jgi:hypothetical protein